MSDMDLNQILRQGHQIPVMLPEDLEAQKEQEARQARVIGLNTAMALVNSSGAKVDENGRPQWLTSHTDFMASAKEFRGVAEMFAQYILKGVGADAR